MRNRLGDISLGLGYIVHANEYVLTESNSNCDLGTMYVWRSNSSEEITSFDKHEISWL